MPRRTPPYFHFPPVPPLGDAYSFEALTSENADQLYRLFENETSPFTDARFRTLEDARDYAAGIGRWGNTSPKHGGQDWLVHDGEDYVAILHLYDLSLETWNENDRRCWIGFAVRPDARGRGVVSALLRHFFAYIAAAFPRMKYLHAMTKPDNTPARKTLERAGFVVDPEERMGSDEYVFYHREMPRAGVESRDESRLPA